MIVYFAQMNSKRCKVELHASTHSLLFWIIMFASLNPNLNPSPNLCVMKPQKLSTVFVFKENWKLAKTSRVIYRMAEIFERFASIIDHFVHDVTTQSQFMIMFLTLFRANQRPFEVAGRSEQFRWPAQCGLLCDGNRLRLELRGIKWRE